MKRLLFIICALLFVSAGAFAQSASAVHQKTAQDTTGHAIPKALIKVCALSDSACSVASTIYSDNVSTVKANPFTADVTGNYEFWASPGDYTVQVSKAGFQTYSYHTSVGPSMSGANAFTGSNDFGGILHCGSLTAQACITSAASTGKTAYFGPGTYTAALAIPDKAKIECASRLSIFTVANGANVPVMTVANNASNVTIRNCKIDANGSNQSVRQQGIFTSIVNDFTLDNVEITNAHDEGVWVSSGAVPGDPGSKRVKIINSYIHDNGSKNTYIAGVSDFTLNNNTFSNWTTGGAGNAPSMTIYCDNATPTNCNSKVTVTGNRFLNGIGTRFAIESAGSTLNVVDGCNISGNVMDGNSLDGDGISGSFSNCVMDNTFNNGGGGHRSGYEIVGAHDKLGGTINNGTIAISGIATLTTTDIQVVPGTSITNASANGANDASCVLIGGSNSLTKITVRGIKCFLTNASPQTGIYIGVYGTAQQVNDITVENNELYGPGAAGHGIRLNALTGSSNIRVTGNKVRGFADGWLDNGGTLYDEVTLDHNDFIGNGAPISHTAFTSGTYRPDCNLTTLGQSTMGCAVATPTTYPIITRTTTVGSTTPDVSGNKSILLTGNGSGTVITNFVNGVSGQTLMVQCNDAFTSVASNASIFLMQSVQFNCTTARDYLTVFYDGSVWHEIGRGGGVVADGTLTHMGSNGGALLFGHNMELITLSTVGTTTDSAANLLPTGALIDSVNCRVTTTITTATNWSVGDASTAARFIAANSNLTAGTTAVGLAQWTGTIAAFQASAAKLRITTTGTPGAGVIRCDVFYRQPSAPVS